MTTDVSTLFVQLLSLVLVLLDKAHPGLQFFRIWARTYDDATMLASAEV